VTRCWVKGFWSVIVAVAFGDEAETCHNEHHVLEKREVER
jgi:hypothetical protein